MKGMTVAILAMAVVGASARVVTLSVEAAFHTDEWCSDHHLGEGPSTCIQHSGCCYDGRVGLCHSCDAHSDEWCGKYGEKDVKLCAGYAGCTYDFEKDKCKSNSDPGAITDTVTCEEALAAAAAGDGHAALNFGAADAGGNTAKCAELKQSKKCEKDDDCKWIETAEKCEVNKPTGAMITYTPQCTKQGLWEPEQYDEKTKYKWCVDPDGHEIPDTRRKTFPKDMFKADHINCEKERKQHAGMQCPNAVTLATKGGEVMINDHENVGNCDVSCNTDPDCRGSEWCCYNGCGYSCQEAILPKADCEHLTLEHGLTATDLIGGGSSDSKKHGTQVSVQCADGFTGSDPVNIECKHGHWSDYGKMECFKDCEADFRVRTPLRQRDYEVKGSGNHHGAKRKIRCVKGYGAVAGAPDVLRTFKETLACLNGAWEAQTLECSSCYDTQSIGPQAWWTGMKMKEVKGEEGKSSKVSVGTKRGESFDCQYFASRPHKCADYPEAQAHCRISCRTCEQALMKFKVKAIRTEKPEDARWPEKWIQARVHPLIGHQDMKTVERQTKVAKRVKKGEQ